MVQAQTFEQIIALAKESVWGTGVAPTIMYPVTGGGGSAQSDVIWDEGRRGVPSADFGACIGNSHGEFQLEGLAYPAELGHILHGMLGVDAITGASDPYTHAMTAAVIVPSYTFEDQIISGANGGMRFTGAKPTSLGISWEAESGAATITAQYMTKTPTKVTAANPAVSATLGCGFGGWQFTVTSTGLTSRVTAGELNFTRELAMVYTGENVAAPTFINNGPLRYEGTLTVMADSLADFDRYLLGTTQVMTILATYLSTPARSMQFVSTSTFFAATPISYDRGGLGVLAKVGFRGLHNVTDSGVVKATLINQRATAY